MTWQDLVKQIAAEHGEVPTDAECDFVLIEMTAFPCGGREHVEPQIREFYAAPDRKAYVDGVYASMERATS